MKLTVDAELEKLQRETFGYFLHETNPANGLVIDKTASNWPASIAATGLALACYPVSVERGFMPRPAAVERVLNTLRFFWVRPGGRASAAGHAAGEARCPRPQAKRRDFRDGPGNEDVHCARPGYGAVQGLSDVHRVAHRKTRVGRV